MAAQSPSMGRAAEHVPPLQTVECHTSSHEEKRSRSSPMHKVHVGRGRGRRPQLDYGDKEKP